jgi:hypothetical protein
MQALNGAVRPFASRPDQGVAFFGLEVKNGVYFDQVD